MRVLSSTNESQGVKCSESGAVQLCIQNLIH